MANALPSRRVTLEMDGNDFPSLTKPNDMTQLISPVMGSAVWIGGGGVGLLLVIVVVVLLLRR